MVLSNGNMRKEGSGRNTTNEVTLAVEKEKSIEMPPRPSALKSTYSRFIFVPSTISSQQRDARSVGAIYFEITWHLVVVVLIEVLH
jgi:hypothetical protein